MFDEDRPRVVKKERLDVSVQLTSGESFTGTVYLRKYERVIDLMNDERSFIPMTIDGDVVKVVNKAAVAEISVVIELEDDDAKEFNVPDASHYSLTIKQAMAIYGIKSGYTREELRDRHKKLISRLHPDIGGSDYLTGQLNTARDILMRELKKGESDSA